MAVSTEPGDGRCILPTHGIELDAMFLLDVSASPIDAHEGEHTIQPILWDVLLQVCFPLKRLERYLAQANPELGALATREVRESQDKAEILYGECLNAVFNDDALPCCVDISAEEYPATIEADWVHINEAVASREVSLEAVAVTAGDEDGSVRCLFPQLIPPNFLEVSSLNE